MPRMGRRTWRAKDESEPASSIDDDLRDQIQKLQEIALRIEHVATEAALRTHPRRERGTDQLVQHVARLEWQRLAREGGPLPSFDEVEFRTFSQNGEDGILWFLFSLLGDGAKKSAEICAGDGIECCSANLIVNHAWNALLVDGDEDLLRRGRHFYEHSGDAWYAPPTMASAWITAENVNDLLATHGFADDLDLLIVDLDGNDYWIWNAIEARPRVVVVETNQVLGPEPSVAVPYDPEMRREPGSNHRSASLRAFVKLAESRGYRLVGVERYGFNAFFVRNDCGADLLPAVSVEECFWHPIVRDAIEVHSARLLQEHEWLAV